jgi:hypothetical protein
MTRPLPFMLLTLGAGCAGGLVAAACSGATDQEVLGPTQSSGSTSASGGSSSGTSGGAGSSGSSSGSTSGDPIPAGCPAEQEKNDGREQANVLSTSLCGEVTPQDHVDFVTFKIQPATKEMKLDYKGGVRLKVEVEGADTVELSPTSNETVPFVPGKPYFIEIRALERNEPATWRLDLIESK